MPLTADDQIEICRLIQSGRVVAIVDLKHIDQSEKDKGLVKDLTIIKIPIDDIHIVDGEIQLLGVGHEAERA